MGALPAGAVPSPNIWQHPTTYEVENRAMDPDGRLEAAMTDLLPVPGWTGRTVLDLGCGTGFHLSRLAELVGPVGTVVGVEPHPDLLALARRRTRRTRRSRGVPTVDVLAGTAQAVPLPDDSVDVVHARWAYFFGPGCEPGLAELGRVLRRGGTALVIDNDTSRSTFGGWFRRGYPHLPRPDEIERFWSTRGFTRTPLDLRWRFDSRQDLVDVVRIELPPAAAAEALAGHTGTEVDYAANLWSRTY